MRCSPGSVLRSAAPALVLGLLLHARKKTESGVRAGARTSMEYTHPPPIRPRHGSRVLLSSRARRGKKANSASCSREAARCRHVTHAARIAMPSALQAGRPVTPCQHVAAFPDRGSRPPPLFPGLSAPIGKARSQSRLRPRKLRVIHLSLRSSRLAAACRLRQSCHPDRGPVALPRSGCPVCRSRHPAAFPCRPQSPPPAAPRGILRSRPAAVAAGHARKTPCHTLQSI